MPPPIYPNPNPEDLWMLPYLKQGLWKCYLDELIGWVLIQCGCCPLKKRRDTEKHTGGKTTWCQRQWLDGCLWKPWKIKDCWQHQKLRDRPGIGQLWWLRPWLRSKAKSVTIWSHSWGNHHFSSSSSETFFFHWSRWICSSRWTPCSKPKLAREHPEPVIQWLIPYKHLLILLWATS